MIVRHLFLTLACVIALTSFVFVGCRPRTTSQKIEDKAEDAQHEINQGMERAKENVHDATR